MTTPATAPPLTASEYQAAQSGLANSLSAQVLAAWDALLDVSALKRTLPVLSAGVAGLVHQYGGASAAVATGYYDSARAAAAARGSYTVVPAQPAGLDQVTAAVRWATKDLWSPEPDTAPAKVLVRGAATRMALDTGRETITAAVAGDRQARGWARHTEPGACYFCAMLASRGAVYKTGQTASFDAHDHDRCQPEPVFGAYEAPAQVRQWQKLWRTSTRGASGKDAIRAFRTAYEGPARDDSTPHGG